jgi:hypothetical protein
MRRERLLVPRRRDGQTLSEAEIINAWRKPMRNSLLEPLIGNRPISKRQTISIGHGVDYIASYWTEDELQSMPPLGDNLPPVEG